MKMEVRKALKMEVRKIVEGATLPWRGDCISCGGKNTLVIRHNQYGIAYWCFRTSCNLKGLFKYHYSNLDLMKKKKKALDIKQ